MTRPNLPRLSAFLLAGLLPCTVLAAGPMRAPAPRVALEVMDRRDDELLPQYRHHNQTWLPGEPGHGYTIRLRNLGAQPVLVVLSVDGVNAISGQTADPDQAGYVLGPWQVLDVEGWRKSMAAVARFVFVDPALSYAARTGRPDNVGVIGIAVFDQRPVPAAMTRSRIAEAEAKAEDATAAGAKRRAPSPAAAPAAESARADAGTHAASPRGHASVPGLGTGHGRIESAPARSTVFVRQPRPAQVTQIRYDTWQGLQARGVPITAPHHRHAGGNAPQAFPQHFVPDPPCCVRTDGRARQE